MAVMSPRLEGERDDAVEPVPTDVGDHDDDRAPDDGVGHHPLRIGRERQPLLLDRASDRQLLARDEQDHDDGDERDGLLHAAAHPLREPALGDQPAAAPA